MRTATGIWGAIAAIAAVAAGFSAALTAPASGQDSVSVTVSASSYGELVRRAEAAARLKLGEIFKTRADLAQVSVNGRNGSLEAPLLEVRINRADWNRRPASLRPYSTYYDVGGLLGFTSAPPVVASKPTNNAPEVEAQKPEAKAGETAAKTAGPLKLEKSEPADGEERAKINRPIELTFAKDLPVKNGEELGIALEPPIDGDVTIEKNVVTFVPATPLAYSRRYTLTLSGSQKLKLPSPLTVNFRTEPQYTYQRDIKGFLAGTCTSCHSLRGTARFAPLDSYESVLAYVSPGQGGQLLDYTGYHGQQNTGARRGLANSAPQGFGAGLYRPNAGVIPNTGGLPAINNRRRTPTLSTPTAPVEPEVDEEGNPIEAEAPPEQASAPTRGGALTEEQARILRTWIVQDQAVER